MALTPINTALIVDRRAYQLELYERPLLGWKFSLTKSYQIAIGAKGYSTPQGLYLINTKAKCPEWLVPNSQWAIDSGLTPGTIVPGCDPNNPLKERWLGITDSKVGIGIHGTASLESLGTRASHGCIRMRPTDIIELFPKVPKYTPIYIF